jgi:hypothetical protein
MVVRERRAEAAAAAAAAVASGSSERIHTSAPTGNRSFHRVGLAWVGMGRLGWSMRGWEVFIQHWVVVGVIWDVGCGPETQTRGRGKW